MKEVFNKLLENSISPNTYYVLFCISNNIVPKHGVSKQLEVKRLQVGEWLTNDIKLTPKSIVLINEIEVFFKTSKKKTSKILLGDSFEETSMPNDNGQDVPVVEVIFKLSAPVEEGIYDYITGTN